MRKRLTEQQKARIKALRKSGKTIQETAKEVGVSNGTVMKYAGKRRKSSGIKRRYRKADSLPIRVKQAEFIEFMADIEELPTYWPWGEMLAFMFEVRKLRLACDKRLKIKFDKYFP